LYFIINQLHYIVVFFKKQQERNIVCPSPLFVKLYCCTLTLIISFINQNCANKLLPKDKARCIVEMLHPVELITQVSKWLPKEILKWGNGIGYFEQENEH